MAATAAAADERRKAPRLVPRRGQVLKRVLASIFACRLLFRRNRAPRGRRGNRVPAGGGHVEPEPDVAARAAAAAHHHDNTATNYPPLAEGDDATY
ncbi:hypothetical protein HU200_000099 [Digitaria exilis]|uniref:Uncharacterized protein n=1 Tax=Digitaria exilis TaxID=1010633 RepID=A0A835G2D5_9POAL|nr:hypothetical protein HU200_000099 [Digitaria exilis]CAB3469928.1 unnamed protein product [Digitaria exilis]